MVEPGQAVTMDYREERVTVTVDSCKQKDYPGFMWLITQNKKAHELGFFNSIDSAF